MPRAKPINLPVRLGGALMSALSGETVGPLNYERKRDWRRVQIDQEARAEGCDYFIVNPASGALPWVPGQVYQQGDEVTYNGSTYARTGAQGVVIAGGDDVAGTSLVTDEPATPKPSYTHTNATGFQVRVWWYEPASQWRIDVATVIGGEIFDLRYFSTDAVATPDLVTTWQEAKPYVNVVVNSLPGVATDPPMTGLFAWYKADSLSLADNTVVLTVSDETGNGNTLTDASATYTQFENDVINGKPAFKAVNFLSQMQKSAGINYDGVATGYSMLLVVQTIHRNSGPGELSLAVSGSEAQIRSTVSGANEILYGKAGVGEDTPTIIVPLSTWSILSLRIDNTEGILKFYTNDETATGAAGAAVIPSGLLAAQIESGYWPEALFYRVKLTDSEMAQARNYLADKYGIAITV